MHKKTTLRVATFFTIATFLAAVYSCTPDKVLIDTSLKLPPVPLDTTGWTVVDYTSQEDNDGEARGPGRDARALARPITIPMQTVPITGPEANYERGTWYSGTGPHKLHATRPLSLC